jgi:hypothetical protein
VVVTNVGFSLYFEFDMSLTLLVNDRSYQRKMKFFSRLKTSNTRICGLKKEGRTSSCDLFE